MSRSCPKSGETLQAMTFGEVEIDVSSTGGAWLDADELNALGGWFHEGDSFQAYARRFEARPTHDAVTGPCPHCRTPTFEAYPVETTTPGVSVTLDLCRTCKGIWIDGPELLLVREALIAIRDAGTVGTVRVTVPRPLWARIIYPTYLRNLVDALLTRTSK